MAVVFGYGRSLIKEEMIERHFGLKVCLNILDQTKMRSINAATIEDMIVTTQKQASYSTSQEEFDINTINDIIRGVTGVPYEEQYGTIVSGKDSLVVSIQMHLSELAEKLKLFYNAYANDRYKEIGFEWVDNVSEVRDPVLKNTLLSSLEDLLKNKQLENIYVAPPETVDWEHTEGFFLGNGKKASKQENYSMNIEFENYIDLLKPNIDIMQKIKRDRLMVWTSGGQSFVVCSIFSAIVCQLEYNDKTYIFNYVLGIRLIKHFMNELIRIFIQFPFLR